MCEGFQRKKSSFSLAGQQWLDDVLFCEQTALQPWSVPNPFYTCSTLESAGAVHHSNCWTKSSPTYCSLSPEDLSNFLVTARQSVMPPVTFASLIKPCDVVRECGLDFYDEVLLDTLLRVD